MSHVRRISSSIMKRAIKQWWSTISPVSTKRTTSPHFKSHTHTHDHTFVMSCRLLVVGGKTRVSVQIHHILFSLRQSKPQALVFRTTVFPHLVPPAIMVWIFVWKYISFNHLSIFYNISCYNSLVLLTFASRSSCRFTYKNIKYG